MGGAQAQFLLGGAGATGFSFEQWPRPLRTIVSATHPNQDRLSTTT